MTDSVPGNHEHYLLDASCFRAVGGNTCKQEALRSAGDSMTTSILAVVEISNVKPTERDFEKRKAAMRALTSLCPKIIGESPDDIVAAAFGMHRPSDTAFVSLDIARTFELASSYDQALAGVVDRRYGVRRKLNPAAAAEWKKRVHEAFANAIRRGNKDAREFLNDSRSLRDILGVADVPAEYTGKTDVLFDSPVAHCLTLMGLAMRAGLLRECEERNNGDFPAAAFEFVPLVLKRYNGKLESYIRMALAYRKWLAPGREPERNAVFDLEYFLHLDAHDINYTFVTTEKKWNQFGADALPGRVMALNDVLVLGK